MNDISGPAEVHDHGYGAGRESFGNYAWTVVAKGWKHKHIRRSHAAEDFRMAYPTTEGDSLLDFKGFHQLLKVAPLRAVTNNGEAGHVASQKRGGCAQREITSLSGNQTANEDQLKFGAG